MPENDTRSDQRRVRDAQIAAEAKIPPLDPAPTDVPIPVEAHLAQRGRRPIAFAGVVENGLVRPLDPAVKLPEHARVIIVAAEVA